MKKDNNKNKFFGLDTAEKAKVVRSAVDRATEEQINLVNRHGGISVLKNYTNCN